MEIRHEIAISTWLQVQKLPLSINGRCYRISSSKKIKLRPCKSTVLNLQLKIKLLDGIQGIIGLLPAFIQQSLTIEKIKRITPQTWDEAIKLELLNRNFHYTVSIKKNEEIAGLILLHSRDEAFVTRYKIL